MAKKRRLTGAIRNDIHNHLMRQSGAVQDVTNAAHDLRVYIAKCWYIWAVSCTDSVTGSLPETCFTKADQYDSLRWSDFYAGLGNSSSAIAVLSKDDERRAFVRGLLPKSYNARQMTKDQVKEVKRLGKNWEIAKTFKDTLTSDLGSVLSSNSTVEGLIDDLPQCEPFAKQFLNPKIDQQTSLVVPGAHKRIRKALRDGAGA